jgi:NADPH2 dehydrogenase
MSTLFTPLQVGSVTIPQRIAMAPMTRFRANRQHIPSPWVKDYYEQRASYPGSLIVTEAAWVSPAAGGYRNVPGIYSAEQIAAWKEVTDAVHANQSFIFMQIWALGRAAELDVLKEETGLDHIVGPSPVPVTPGDGPIPRALEENEIWDVIGQFAQAARNAIEAGFDGVEIHGANGYLVDQFAQDLVNQRMDDWGGSIEKRARFPLEVAKAVANAIGPERTAIRLSPYNRYLNESLGNPVPQFTYLAEKLSELKLAYVHIIRSHSPRVPLPGPPLIYDLDFFVQAYRNASPLIITGTWDASSAREALDTKYKGYDIIAGFGRPYISNPDLIFRIREDIPFAPLDRSTLYAPETPKGHIDFPYHEKFQEYVQILREKQQQ